MGSRASFNVHNIDDRLSVSASGIDYSHRVEVTISTKSAAVLPMVRVFDSGYRN